MFEKLPWNGVSYISIVDTDLIWRLATPSTTDSENAVGDFASGDYASPQYYLFNAILIP